MKHALQAAITCLVLATATLALGSTLPQVTVGSKAFPESWILGEALGELASAGATVTERRNLGGTEVLWNALVAGDIDAYIEYTGTLSDIILKSESRLDLASIRAGLTPLGIGVSDPLGFTDSYALAVTRATAEKLGLRTVSDLARHPELRAAFTHEFMGRKDGYAGLASKYGLAFHDVRGIQHELAYEALASGQTDVSDIYTTDPQIERLGLVLLDDDREFFARYDAVLVYRLALRARAPRAFAEMLRLVGVVDQAHMLRANSLVATKAESPEGAATWLLRETLGSPGPRQDRRSTSAAIGAAVLRHLELVCAALLAAICVGIPLGIFAARSRGLGALTLTTTGLLQTIPSLALLALLIPILGIGAPPALVALFLYGLLPIVRNTYAGLTGIAPNLIEAAEAIGLSPRERLIYVELPLALPTIMAGITTSATITVGTATLAALVGAGGLGDAILEGIALRDTGRILQGALPAAALALLVQAGFALLERAIVPRGLQAGR
jgi:osmoprotectant transport system permease protein